MAEIKWSIPVDQELRPAYYDDFRCIAQDCRITCCAGWMVTFDKNDYFRLKKLARDLSIGKELEKSLARLRDKGPDIHYGEMRLRKDRSCPLLAECGLCGLQMEAGEKALPEICRNFPRTKTPLPSGFLERSLTPACEAVLHRLWDLPEGIAFRSAPLPEKERLRFHAEEGLPSPLVSHFSEIRSVCVDLLQDRQMPLTQRVLLVGLRLRELAETPPEQLDVPAWIQKTGALLADPAAPELCRTLAPEGDRAKARFLTNSLHTLVSLDAMDPLLPPVRAALLEALGLEWMQLLGEVPLRLDLYRQAEAAFHGAFGDREYFFENLAVAVFFHLHMPLAETGEQLWKSYVNYCHLLSFFRFVSVLSAVAALPAAPGEEEAPAPGSREALVRVLVLAGRDLLHNSARAGSLRDEFFKNDSATLAHMAILLG